MPIVKTVLREKENEKKKFDSDNRSNRWQHRIRLQKL
jgi:hypothetical protein